jgi:hypothetical protein
MGQDQPPDNPSSLLPKRAKAQKPRLYLVINGQECSGSILFWVFSLNEKENGRCCMFQGTIAVDSENSADRWFGSDTFSWFHW